MLKKILFILCVLMIANTAYAQKVEDKPYVSDTTKWSRPKKVTFLAFVPGLGQIYNKKYWKLPIVYGGFAALIYSVTFYQKQYDDLRQAVKDRNAGLTLTDPSLEPLDIANLVSFRDFYRENRDLSWIGIGALYGLQIMDAAVDAHLQEFDVTENLSLRWQPDYRIQYGQAFLGATFTFTLK
jgi:hypothetical protein